jgi:RNA polymerase sigma-70 factor (ECF subfamily)
MRVHKHRDNYDPEKSSIRTWLFNITNRILIDYYRLKKLNTIALDISVGDNEENSNRTDSIIMDSHVATSTPHMEMVTKETIMHAEKAIVKLPKKLRRVSNLFFNHHYMLQEIAERCDMPLGTVKNSIFKARKLLQKQLERI